MASQAEPSRKRVLRVLKETLSTNPGVLSPLITGHFNQRHYYKITEGPPFLVTLSLDHVRTLILRDYAEQDGGQDAASFLGQHSVQWGNFLKAGVAKNRCLWPPLMAARPAGAPEDTSPDASQVSVYTFPVITGLEVHTEEGGRLTTTAEALARVILAALQVRY